MRRSATAAADDECIRRGPAGATGCGGLELHAGPRAGERGEWPHTSEAPYLVECVM